MDLLADVLAVSAVRGTLGARIDAGADWGAWVSPSPSAAFHAVTSGTAWLGLPGRPPVQLMPGDVILLPTGTEHVLGSDAAAVMRTSERVSDSWECTGSGTMRLGSGPTRTHILCAHYDHDPAISTQVVTLLPEVVHLRAENGGGCLDDTVRLLARELAHPQVATAVVLDRLVDILLVQLLRVWLASEPAGAQPSWLGALSDATVGAAVAKLHEQPARAWTTAMLAEELAVSRATLSRRFAAVLGESPGAYLTRWRMDLAARRLRDSDDSLETIAADVGYTSVYAFSRAFSRARSQPPGRFRSSARASLAGAAGSTDAATG